MKLGKLSIGIALAISSSIPLNGIAQEVVDEDRCSGLFFFGDHWKQCVEDKFKQGLQDAGEKMIEDLAWAVAETVAMQVLPSSISSLIFGSGDGNEALAAAVSQIISAIESSESDIIAAINDSFEDREYASFRALNEGVETFMKLDLEEQLLESRQNELSRMISALSNLSFNFTVHRSFDAVTYTRIKAIELSLRAMRKANENYLLGTVEQTAEDFRQEYMVVLRNAYDVMYSEFGSSKFHQAFFDYNEDYFVARADNYWGEVYCPSDAPKPYSSYQYDMKARDGSRLKSITTCDPGDRTYQRYDACVTSLFYPKEGTQSYAFAKDYTHQFEGAPFDPLISVYSPQLLEGLGYWGHHKGSDFSIFFQGNQISRCWESPNIHRGWYDDGTTWYDEVIEVLYSYNKYHGSAFNGEHSERIFQEFRASHAFDIEGDYHTLWSTLDSWAGMSGYPFRETLFAKTSKIYWRDMDRDGLRYFEEVELGSNNFHADEDGDGFTDYLEVRCGTDPATRNGGSLSAYLASTSCAASQRHYGEFQDHGTTTRTYEISLPPGKAHLMSFDHDCGSFYETTGATFNGNGDGLNFFVNFAAVEQDKNFRASYFVSAPAQNVFVVNGSQTSRSTSITIEFECTD